MYAPHGPAKGPYTVIEPARSLGRDRVPDPTNTMEKFA